MQRLERAMPDLVLLVGIIYALYVLTQGGLSW